MKQPHFVAAYQAHTEELLRGKEDEARALELAVGVGRPEEFAVVGQLQHQLLVAHGLEPSSSLVEVGCGAGRLAVQLAGWLEGPYLGLDVVPVLLDRARSIASASNMQYQQVDGLMIPLDAAAADMVCAFSVFTHLRHEESYAYMQDCTRVLKPGGELIFSFLEYRVPAHWAVMESNLNNIGSPGVLNQFMSADAVEAWSHRLDLEIEGLFRGDEPFIPLAEPITLNGSEFRDFGTFGQSVAVLRKPVTR